MEGNLATADLIARDLIQYKENPGQNPGQNPGENPGDGTMKKGPFQYCHSIPDSIDQKRLW